MERFSDFRLGGSRDFFEQRSGGRDEKPRRTEPTLQRVFFDERFLKRMESVAFGEPFDRDDRRVVRLGGEHRAALHRSTVDEHGARSALARVTADVGPRQAELVP